MREAGTGGRGGREGGREEGKEGGKSDVKEEDPITKQNE